MIKKQQPYLSIVWCGKGQLLLRYQRQGLIINIDYRFLPVPYDEQVVVVADVGYQLHHIRVDYLSQLVGIAYGLCRQAAPCCKIDQYNEDPFAQKQKLHMASKVGRFTRTSVLVVAHAVKAAAMNRDDISCLAITQA